MTRPAEEVDPKDRRLYAFATYERTPRLKDLLNQEQRELTYVENVEGLDPSIADFHDIRELWTVYTEGNEAAGFTPTLLDFAEWLLGVGAYGTQGIEQADVFW